MRTITFDRAAIGINVRFLTGRRVREGQIYHFTDKTVLVRCTDRTRARLSAANWDARQVTLVAKGFAPATTVDGLTERAAAHDWAPTVVSVLESTGLEVARVPAAQQQRVDAINGWLVDVCNGEVEIRWVRRGCLAGSAHQLAELASALQRADARVISQVGRVLVLSGPVPEGSGFGAVRAQEEDCCVSGVVMTLADAGFPIAIVLDEWEGDESVTGAVVEPQAGREHIAVYMVYRGNRHATADGGAPTVELERIRSLLSEAECPVRLGADCVRVDCC